MDGGFNGEFGGEDPNNRPEEITLDNLGDNDYNDNDYDDDNDDEFYDAHEETLFISAGGTEMFDKDGMPITPLEKSTEYKRLQRDHALWENVQVLRTALMDVTGKHVTGKQG